MSFRLRLAQIPGEMTAGNAVNSPPVSIDLWIPGTRRNTGIIADDRAENGYVPFCATVISDVSDLLAKRREERRAKALRLSLLGWTIREIAERLGIGKSQVSDDLSENFISELSGQGHTSDEVALRLGVPIQVVKAIQLKDATDEARMKALRLSLLGWTQAEIAERLGVSRQSIGLDVDAKNFNDELFSSGHTPDEIALRLGVPIQVVKAIQLKDATDEARMKALRLSLLGWTQGEIAERLDCDQGLVSKDMKKFNDEDFHIFQSGHTPDEIALRLGVPIQVVKAIQLKDATDEARMKALRLSLLGWTQAEIAERLGLSQPRTSEIIGNFESELFDSGHTSDEVALRLGVPIQVVKAIQLKDATDEARMKALRLSLLGWTLEEIAERLNVGKSTIDRDISQNFGDELLGTGHTPDEIALRLGVMSTFFSENSRAQRFRPLAPKICPTRWLCVRSFRGGWGLDTLDSGDIPASREGPLVSAGGNAWTKRRWM